MLDKFGEAYGHTDLDTLYTLYIHIQTCIFVYIYIYIAYIYIYMYIPLHTYMCAVAICRLVYVYIYIYPAMQNMCMNMLLTFERYTYQIQVAWKPPGAGQALVYNGQYDGMGQWVSGRCWLVQVMTYNITSLQYFITQYNICSI